MKQKLDSFRIVQNKDVYSDIKALIFSKTAINIHGKHNTVTTKRFMNIIAHKTNIFLNVLKFIKTRHLERHQTPATAATLFHCSDYICSASKCTTSIRLK